MATDQHAYALSVAVENTQWPTAATMADETATEADAQWATTADEIATDQHAPSVAVEYTHSQWATAATMADETATEADAPATDQPKADSQTTVANAQHNLRATHYDH